jgi:hypothetical protein
MINIFNPTIEEGSLYLFILSHWDLPNQGCVLGITKKHFDG